MKSWVKPYLLRELRDKINRFSKQPEEIKRKWMQLKSKEFKDEKVVFMHLLRGAHNSLRSG